MYLLSPGTPGAGGGGGGGGGVIGGGAGSSMAGIGIVFFLPLNSAQVLPKTSALAASLATGVVWPAALYLIQARSKAVAFSIVKPGILAKIHARSGSPEM